jgi:ABC-type uncharacterized transport system permease subunit
LSQSRVKSSLFSIFIVEVLWICTALIVGLGCGGLVAWSVGESPMHVIKVILDGAFGTAYDVGMVVYFTTILICTGLAVAVPLQIGNFNIGAEGQTLMGAFAAGSISAAIRSFKGGHEVISSIMLNFIAAGLTSWLVVAFFQANDSQIPETKTINSNYHLLRFSMFDGAPATMVVLVALCVTIVFWIFLDKTRWGFQVKAIRQSPAAAAWAGYNANKSMFWVFTVGSAICGIAGAVMVLGESWRFRLEISDGFGFLGIPVALLGRGRPLGIVLAAVLFAVLHHGAMLLDIESTKVGRDVAQVIEALIVLSVVSVPPFVQWSKLKLSIGLQS